MSSKNSQNFWEKYAHILFSCNRSPRPFDYSLTALEIGSAGLPSLWKPYVQNDMQTDLSNNCKPLQSRSLALQFIKTGQAILNWLENNLPYWF